MDRIKRKLLEEKNDQDVAVMKIKYETTKKENQLQMLRKTEQGERTIHISPGTAV